jgi:hypothetical protein
MSEQVKLDKLSAHPALATFPLLSAEQLAVLTQSIAEHGVLKPLVAIQAPNGAGLVIDGRNRLQAAQNNFLASVPVEWAPPGTNPIVYALESAISGRNLTKSGIVLLLLEQHPDLAETRANRESRGLKRGKNPNVSPLSLNDSGNEFDRIAERYNVPRTYFSDLIKIRETLAEDEESWERVRGAILNGEGSIPAMVRGAGGAVATKGKNRVDANLNRLGPACTTSLVTVLKKWADFPKVHPRLQERILHNLEAGFSLLPPEVRKINADVIVETWPAHEKEALRRRLKS